MTKQLYAITVALILPILSFCQPVEKEEIRLFYLGGQSNMDGYGYIKDLPEALDKSFEDVWVFNGNSAADGEKNGGLGKWDKLKPGYGVGFSSDGVTNKFSNRFGIELSFVKRLQEFFPGEKIAIIKYSRGGSSLDSLAASYFGSWEPDFIGENGINQYDHFLTTLRNAFQTKDIDGNGKEDRLIPGGILWMQGESDATVDEALANRYYANLKRLMDLIRAALHKDDLPVVIGKISDSWNDPKDGKVWDYGELVQYGQEKYARTEANVAIVRSTHYYKYSDPWHYDSEGYIDLGEKFAEAIHQLITVE